MPDTGHLAISLRSEKDSHNRKTGRGSKKNPLAPHGMFTKPGLDRSPSLLGKPTNQKQVSKRFSNMKSEDNRTQKAEKRHKIKAFLLTIEENKHLINVPNKS